MREYKRSYNTGKEKPERVVVLLPREELDKIDGWGVPAGMPSRSVTIRKLVEKGLAATKNEKSGTTA